MAGETQPGVGTVGARLRAAREVKRLSVHAIATTTKVPVGALDALEEDDVARLPGGIFSRGFVRSYAAAVGLNPEQTVRDFVAQLPAPERATDAVADDRPYGDHRSTRQWLVAGWCLGGCWSVARGRRSSSSAGYPACPPAPIHHRGRSSRWHRTRRWCLVWRSGVVSASPRRSTPVRQAPLTIVLRPRRDCWVSLRNRRRVGGAARHARGRAGNQRGTPSFGQVFVTAKVESGS